MSEIRATTISNAAGTGPITMTGQSAAKAWNSFNGTGTIAFIKSFNGSSLVDVGTGEYDVNITSAMDSTNYSILASAGLNVVHNASDTLGYPNTTTQYSVAHWENNGKQDIVYISGQINGDLA
jgi:hypothetical protein